MNSSNSNIVGNVYDKYGTKNPLAAYLMRQFLSAAIDCYESFTPATVLEVGCGEGKLAKRLLESAKPPRRFAISDLSLDRLLEDLPQELEPIEASVYSLPFEDGEFDLVICCEVLEHLDEPAQALAEIQRVARNGAIVSTPREPLWRILNCCRGKYLTSLGNTPGHIQHFSKTKLRKLVSQFFRIKKLKSPLPWTMIAGECL